MKVLVHAMIAGLLSAAPAGAAPEEPRDDTSIRAFDLATTEKLGRDLYQADHYAAGASDILVEHLGSPQAVEAEGIRGWIVSTGEQGAVVRFIKELEGNNSPAYDVIFTAPEQGELVAATGTLSQAEIAQYSARQLALRNIRQPCSERYNSVVLPDVDGDGFLVYALAATTEPDQVLVGGHYRMTVSADGTTLERIDRLSRGCTVLSESEVPEDSSTAGLVALHAVSPRPVETHVFLGLLHKRRIFVLTLDGEWWKVEQGRITALGRLGGGA